ncbi:hypothetical protein, partial [Fusicatenibacter sp.]
HTSLEKSAQIAIFFHLILIQNNDEFFRRFGFSVLICTNARKIAEKKPAKNFFCSLQVFYCK